MASSERRSSTCGLCNSLYMKQIIFILYNDPLTASNIIIDTLKLTEHHYDETMNRANGNRNQQCKPKLKKTTRSTAGPVKDNNLTSNKYLNALVRSC